MREPAGQGRAALERNHVHAKGGPAPSKMAIAAAVALVVGLGLAGCGSDSTAPSNRADREWLFSFTASDVATFDRATGRLTVPTSHVVAFSDRPYRDTRSLRPFEFVNLWRLTSDDSFASDPPNAVLTYREADDERARPATVVVEVGEDAAYDTAHGAIVLGLRVLDPVGLTLPERIYDASLFVDGLTDCDPLPEDEDIVEYFNEQIFDDGFIILVTPTPTGAYELTLSCPERETPEIPPPDFELTLSTADQSLQTSCESSVPITLATSNPTCDSDQTCHLVVEARNRTTLAIYSQTVIQIMLNGGAAIIPELEPAGIALCPDDLTLPGGVVP